MHSSFLLFPNKAMQHPVWSVCTHTYSPTHTHAQFIQRSVPADRQTANKTNIRTNKQHQHLKSIARNAIPFIFAPFWRTHPCSRVAPSLHNATFKAWSWSWSTPNINTYSWYLPTSGCSTASRT